MRTVLYAAAAVATAVSFSPALVSAAMAAAAGALCEATPFLLAGTFAETLLHDDRLVAYFGCGCTRGATARSIPATVATALTFGAFVALARFAAAVVVEGLVARHRNADAHDACAGGCARNPAPLLDGLHALAVSSLIAGCASQFGADVSGTLSPLLAAIAGLALGAFATPCALGVVAIAAALHARAPIAAYAYLCVAGIVDFHALSFARKAIAADAAAYLMLAAGLAIVAIRHGDALVRPAFTPAIAVSACAACAFGLWYRNRRDPTARIAPAILLGGALVIAPPPAYTATETTMTDLFAGEPLDFTGRLVRTGHAAALVRYAVTCCRLDAAPVVVRLSAIPLRPDGTWMRAFGAIENDDGVFRLRARTIAAVTPPADPFIYR